MTFKALFILTAFIQLHYHSLKVQHFKICTLLKEVNCRGLKPMENVRCVGKGDWRGENRRCLATEMWVRCLTSHRNMMFPLLKDKKSYVKKMKFNALCIENSRVKQVKDEIHYYLSQLKSVGLITIQTLTISNVIFKKYLYNSNVSY